MVSLVRAADVSPEANAAFERYVKQTEQRIEKRTGLHDFLWIDQHAKEKSLVWLGQSVITQVKPVEDGKDLDIPGATLQHWLGVILLEGATLERLRDYLLNYGDYRFYFKQFFVDTRLVKRDGDSLDALLRLSRKQLSTVMLNLNVSAKWVVVDATRGYIFSHSTHIGEVVHPRQRATWSTERPAADASGYLWRQNVYWRISQSGDGTYVEMESITLSRSAGALNPSRFLNGFVQNYPQEFVDGSLSALREAFPRPH